LFNKKATWRGGGTERCQVAYEYVFLASHRQVYISNETSMYHPIFYFKKSVASDESWDRKALQLAHLQHIHGYDAGTWKNEAFEGFTGDTGYHLPVTDEIRDQAQKLINDDESGD
jgi:hypothetical protein